MQETINKLKTLKNATETQINEVIYMQSHKSVLKDLKADGIDINDLSKEEFNQILAEEIKKQKAFSKGTLAGMSALMFLELLG